LQAISYAEFGHNFIQQVVTAHRLGNEIEALLERTIAGSMRKLPADMLMISYVFKLEDISVDPLLNHLPKIAFMLCVRGDLQLDVELFGIDLKFSLAVSIQVQIDVETYAPVTLRLVPHPVSGHSIRIDLVGENLPSDVLDRLKLVKPIVRDQIVKEVNARINDPSIQTAANIDVLALVSQVKMSG
jgi:hypothetical protein